MGAQIRYLKFFNYFWANNVFIYAFLAIALLSLIYLVRPNSIHDPRSRPLIAISRQLVNPADKSSDTDLIRQKIEKQVRSNRV